MILCRVFLASEQCCELVERFFSDNMVIIK